MVDAAPEGSCGAPHVLDDEARRRAVRRLATARLLSVSGSGAAYVALVYSLYERTGSATWVTAAMLATIGVQSLVLPAASLLGDRVDRIRLLVVCDCLGGLLFTSLILGPSVEMTLLVAVLATTAEAPFLPASAALLPDLSGTERLTWANGVVGAATAAGRTAGPVIAGMLFVVGDERGAYVFNGVSFLLSAILVATLPRARTQARAVPVEQTRLRVVLRRVRHNRGVALLLLSSLTAYAATSFVMVAEPALAESFGAGGTGYGIMTAAWGAGVALGAYATGRILDEVSEPAGALVGRLLMGTGISLVPLSPWFPAVPLLMAVGGIGSGALAVALQSQVQRLTPAGSRSTVFGLFEAVGTASFVLGVTLAGVLVPTIGVRAAYVVGGAGTFLAALPLVANARLAVSRRR